ncbi:MAG: Rid family detoxifying hydrolase [Aureispira sp.]
MKKKIITTNQGPAPVAPYNQAVVANGTVYVSGQIALDPATGLFPADILTDIRKETHQVLKNLGAVLEAANSSFENVLKCTIFMADMKDYAAINEVYAHYFKPEGSTTNTAPAREAVAVKELPKSVNVEISCIALVNE